MSTSNITRSRQLAMQARMSIGPLRAQHLMQNWLSRGDVDEAVGLVQACAGVLGMGSSIGDWDALAHCVANSLYYDATETSGWNLEWIYGSSGLYSSLADQTEFDQRMYEVFGHQFIGNPHIVNFNAVHLGTQSQFRIQP